MLEYHARYDDPASGQFITPDSSVVGAGPLTVWPSDATAQGMGRSAGSGPVNPQDLNRSADALNHPLTYTDPTGHWVETAWDLANLVLSAAAVWQHPSDPWNWAALAADTASTVLPGVPGGAGAVIRAAAHADEAAGALHAMAHADEAAGAAQAAARVLTREQVIQALGEVVQPYLTSVRELAGEHARIGFRGSLARGTVGNPNKPTFGQPVNLSDFDVDAFIISDELIARTGKRWGSQIEEIKGIQKAIEAALQQRPEFAGLRKDGFTFRLFTRSQAERRFTGEEIYFIGGQ